MDACRYDVMSRNGAAMLLHCVGLFLHFVLGEYWVNMGGMYALLDSIHAVTGWHASLRCLERLPRSIQSFQSVDLFPLLPISSTRFS